MSTLKNMKNMNYKDVLKYIKEKGFEIDEQKGSHVKIWKPNIPKSQTTIVKNSKDSFCRRSLNELYKHIQKFLNPP